MGKDGRSFSVQRPSSPKILPNLRLPSDEDSPTFQSLQVHSVIADLQGMRYRLRTSMVGSSRQAFQAVGFRPPEMVTLRGLMLEDFPLFGTGSDEPTGVPNYWRACKERIQ